MHTESIQPASERCSKAFKGSAEISRSGSGGSGAWGDKDSRTNYLPGAVLYRQGQQCAGIFRIESGDVKLSISGSSGRTAILKIAQPGELMGVTEAFLNCPYVATAETIGQSAILFIARSHLQGIWSHGELTAQIIAQLTRECSRMFREVSSYRLSSSASQRLAHLLLELLEQETKSRHKRVIEMPYTHAEIGQLIGCSRETVTRLLKSFQEKKLIGIDHSNVYIGQIQKLQQLARCDSAP